jgi:hypothetical protein
VLANHGREGLLARAALLDEVDALLRDGHNVLLFGPAGVGTHGCLTLGARWRFGVASHVPCYDCPGDASCRCEAVATSQR